MSTLSQVAHAAFDPNFNTVPGTDGFQKPLTGHDRCDVGECGAQAYVRVEFRTGVLLFCAHHYAEQPLSLQQSSISIHDERAQLAAKLDVSA